jgi:hypothetical protein
MSSMDAFFPAFGLLITVPAVFAASIAALADILVHMWTASDAFALLAELALGGSVSVWLFNTLAGSCGKLAPSAGLQPEVAPEAGRSVPRRPRLIRSNWLPEPVFVFGTLGAAVLAAVAVAYLVVSALQYVFERQAARLILGVALVALIEAAFGWELRRTGVDWAARRGPLIGMTIVALVPATWLVFIAVAWTGGAPDAVDLWRQAATMVSLLAVGSVSLCWLMPPPGRGGERTTEGQPMLLTALRAFG